jgi:hypothetical protein
MMDIRDEIESYINLLAPKGVVIAKEEKANLFFSYLGLKRLKCHMFQSY